MQTRNLLFTGIREALTLQSAAKKAGRHVVESDLDIVSDAALVCVDGRVAWIGPQAELPDVYKNFVRTDLGGRCILPGLIECHTHTVFAGNRAEEFEWRMQGQSYQEISAKGGGILSTVRATRAASENELHSLAQARVDRFVRQGVTTLECKTGYALDEEHELKCLRVAGRLHGPRIVRTYLGAHSRSPDYPDLASYVEAMVHKILPRLARERLADRVDIYIEKGFYDLQLARTYLRAAKDLGFALTAHVEQLSDFGGTDLALEFTPQSVDHVVYLNDSSLARLAAADTTAVLLPSSDLYLKMRYPPARQLLDHGARVALSTDFNPGTSPTQDLSLVGLLARVEMKMSLAEVLSAFTVGAAYALGLSAEVGSLSVGKQCDFVVLEGSWRDLFYGIGWHPVCATYRRGETLWND